MQVDIKDGDAVVAISYICGTSCYDGKLRTLSWADGCNRTDYLYFGDVVFHTTYKKNIYNYPLVIFSRCNHHSQNVIFGAALVLDETTETYQWMLKCFLEAMRNTQPNAFVTDEDLAMKEAVRTYHMPVIDYTLGMFTRMCVKMLNTH